MRNTLIKIRRFNRDETGGVLVEHVILLAITLAAAVWLNHSVDAVLFGTSPYDNRAGGRHPAMGYHDLATGEWKNPYGARTEAILNDIDRDPSRAYLAQLYLSLARP